MNSEIANAVGILAATQGVGFAVLALVLGTPVQVAAMVVFLPVVLLVIYELNGGETDDDQAADAHAEVEA